MKWLRFNDVWKDRAGNLVKVAPLQANPRDNQIPWEVAAEGYKEYAAQFGTNQSLERLCERGGFGPTELAILLFERIKRIESPRMETRTLPVAVDDKGGPVYALETPAAPKPCLCANMTINQPTGIPCPHCGRPL